MRIFQTDRPLRRLADMGDHVARTNRIMANQFSDRRLTGRLRIEENANALVFKKGDTPAVTVNIRSAAARLEPCLAE